jgi:hypothetical protein
MVTVALRMICLQILRAFGTDESALPESLQGAIEYEVLPENWDAVLMFLRVESQWRTTSAGVMGLDYGVLLGPGGMLDLYGCEDPKDTLESVQVIEAKARQLINDKAKADTEKAQQTVKKRRR